MANLRDLLFFFLLSLLLPFGQLTYPKPCLGQENTAYPSLNDDALNLFLGPLSKQEIKERDILKADLIQFRETTNRKFVVVLINSLNEYPGTANESLDAFANALFQFSGLAQNSQEYDDSILLVIARKSGESFLKIGSHYLDSTQAEVKQLNDEVIAPAVKNGKIFEAIRDNIPRVRQTLFGYLFEPMPFPWYYIYIPALVLGVIITLISLFKYLFKLTWQSATIFTFGGVFFVLLYLVTPSPNTHYYQRDPGGPIARLLEEFWRRKKPGTHDNG